MTPAAAPPEAPARTTPPCEAGILSRPMWIVAVQLIGAETPRTITATAIINGDVETATTRKPAALRANVPMSNALVGTALITREVKAAPVA